MFIVTQNFIHQLTVVALGGYTFYGCYGLSGINIPAVELIGAGSFGNTGDQSLTISLGSAAPDVAGLVFTEVSVPKSVTVKVPVGAMGYDTNWENGFRGLGTVGTPGTLNTFIDLTIDEL